MSPHIRLGLVKLLRSADAAVGADATAAEGEQTIGRAPHGAMPRAGQRNEPPRRQPPLVPVATAGAAHLACGFGERADAVGVSGLRVAPAIVN
eukprot:gene5150-18802_t